MDVEMALSQYWEDHIDIDADQVDLRTPASLLTRDRAKTDQSDRWAANLYEPTTVSVGRHPISSKSALPTIRSSTMPVTSGSQSLLASLPTFMSVFGDNSGARNARLATAPHNASAPSNTSSNTANLQSASRALNNTNTRPPFHSNLSSPPTYRRDSAVTIQTESTESSPTTTISTVDSTMTEPSPSSSPESPASLLPTSSLSSPKSVTPSSMDDTLFRSSFPSSPSPNRTGFNRSDSPNKKPRNMKNLFVNTSGANKPSPGTALPRLASSDPSTVLPGQNVSAPASPAFVIPFMAPKRKPSKLGLSITTADPTTKGPIIRSGPEMVPQTPSFAHLSHLRNTESSFGQPLFSPTVAPEGGMRLPPLGGIANTNLSAKSRPALSFSHNSSLDSSNSSPIVLQTLDHVQEESDHDLPLSREVKSPAYPEGPVCIYPPNVFLYLEPNDSEAAKFDVVINVAREVINPFIAAKEDVEPKTRDVGVQVNLFPQLTYRPSAQDTAGEPPSAVSEKSFRSAFDMMPTDAISNVPDTPRAVIPEPEYIHVPWEHNTKVSVELLELCELIDERVSRGKRVLIHCQCGVSRSASLIIAYGLYKNPELSDNEAYNLVKARSRWINPNMHFIFELHAFRQMLLEKLHRNAHSRRGGPGMGLMRTQTDSILKSHSHSIQRMSPVQDEPSTAPLQKDLGLVAPRSNSLNPPGSAQLASLSSLGDMTPGPSSAPPDWAFSPTTETAPGPAYVSEQLGNRPSESQGGFHESPMSQQLANIMGGLSTENREAAMATRDDEQTHEQNHDVMAEPLQTLSPPNPTPVLRSVPSLPGGFSSLMGRRQVTRQLPFRTEAGPASPSLPIAHSIHIPLDKTMIDDVPSTPSLLSPRAVEFTASPFHRTVAGDLAGASIYEQAKLGQRIEDPRSPPIRGEAPITRSIDDVL